MKVDEKRGLSTGDGIAIAALLLFLLTWTGAGLWLLSTAPSEKIDDEASDTALLLLLPSSSPRRYGQGCG